MSDQKKSKAVEIKPKLSEKAKEKLQAVPGAVSTAIEEGKGNSVIAAFQTIMLGILTAPVEACKIISQQILLLVKTYQKALSVQAYAYGMTLSGFLAIYLIIDFSLKDVLASIAMILAAFALDRIIFLSKPAISKKQTTKSNKKNDKDLYI